MEGEGEMEVEVERSSAAMDSSPTESTAVVAVETLGNGDVDGGMAGKGEDRVKGPWSPEEDAILSRLVNKFGARNWSLIAKGIPGRSGKSCRLRWCNQLDPGVKRKPFTGMPQSSHFSFPYFLDFVYSFSEWEIE